MTASFADVPASHDGAALIVLPIALDAPLSTSWTGVRDALAVTGGALTRVQRVDGRSDLWSVRATPSGDADVTVRLTFSEPLASSYSYETMRDRSLGVWQGQFRRATEARRLEPPGQPVLGDHDHVDQRAGHLDLARADVRVHGQRRDVHGGRPQALERAVTSAALGGRTAMLVLAAPGTPLPRRQCDAQIGVIGEGRVTSQPSTETIDAVGRGR